MDTKHAEHIFLIGSTGSGKTTVGRALAALLGWTFADTDDLVVAAAGKSIPAIFAEDGEPHFRDLERAALAEAATFARAVIATGAGIVESRANRALMQAAGTIIQVGCRPELALERLQAESKAADHPIGFARPMLAAADALSRLRELETRRMPFYIDADATISTEGCSIEEAARAVVAALVCDGVLPTDGAVPAVRSIATSGAPYEACVSWGGLAVLGKTLEALDYGHRAFICIDDTVAKIYEIPLLTLALRGTRKRIAAEVYRVPSGEQSKSSEQLGAIYDWLAEHRAERRDLLVAIGGGVIGDLAGFAAATYLRGMPLVHVPTTLLAQVDSSLGGKTGINHPRGKNLIGAFYPPRLVIADPALLLTLPTRQRIEGWAEVIKHGVALDADYFGQLERDVDALLAMRPAPLTKAVAGSVAIKSSVVEGDEREADGGRRHLLNYGHTIGHAIESVAGFGAWLHGEAVSVGMCAAARLGQRLGVTPAEVVDRQEALLARFGLPTRADGLTIDKLLQAVLWDKKVSGGKVRWVLPTRLGDSTLVSDVPEEAVCAVLRGIGAVG
jgi:3-dehydroquinate synthase